LAQQRGDLLAYNALRRDLLRELLERGRRLLPADALQGSLIRELLERMRALLLLSRDLLLLRGDLLLLRGDLLLSRTLLLNGGNLLLSRELLLSTRSDLAELTLAELTDPLGLEPGGQSLRSERPHARVRGLSEVLAVVSVRRHVWHWWSSVITKWLGANRLDGDAVERRFADEVTPMIVAGGRSGYGPEVSGLVIGGPVHD
jgi:hypothetical protein